MQETQVRSPEKIPYVTEQLKPMLHNYCARELQSRSPRHATTEALVPVRHDERSHRNEKPTHHSQRVAPTLRNWRKACAALKTQDSQK